MQNCFPSNPVLKDNKSPHKKYKKIIPSQRQKLTRPHRRSLFFEFFSLEILILLRLF